ncbi:hypothetical protein C9383_23395 [Pseudomonas palleroniana]|uniref:t-SNARE coiled-coil homology domain-containing protein n=1 Tax=Pseudomonas palleroniana TaxID=191390 RepID=A0A1H5NV82_9PSED|nr:hypothetical protein [Pseudomonas palleroniana]KAB0569262.1 hypothetical protein F7R03_05235 [Pseudomonas palleroniana]PTC22419.1 hypothetical protein C9383_23395 [Pseudomonas palleroniana]SEF05593.1 hypothetical protein SAMN04490198_4814 [Pseudomonas palleroniana]
MFSARKPSWMIAVSVIGLLAVGSVGTAQAGDEFEWSGFSSSPGDRLATSSAGAGQQQVLAASNFTVNDIERLQSNQKSHEEELQRLKSKLDEQARYFEEFKRKDGSSSSASDSQLADLKHTVADQKNTIDKLKSEVEDLKRNSSSSSSSSSSELSRLKDDAQDQKRSLEDQKRSLDDLKHTVDTLASKVK